MENIHIGVYGIFVQEGKILLIKKSRGPYIWMYDLPWGKIEFWESREECLKREIDEETWGKLETCEFIWVNEYICEYKNQLQEIKHSHHIGFYYQVSISYDAIKSGPDGHDSLGAEFIDISSLSKIEIAPIAGPMIEECLGGQ